MLFEKIVSEGLAHYSYLIGDKNEAVVIDPRRDIDIYMEKVSASGHTITDVLETHRNEDYLVGSLDIKKKTGAEIWHADDHLDYEYGKPVQEGQKFEIGDLEIKALSTPGHTLNSFSYLLYSYKNQPWMIFTGDILFAGDVGRVDFMGEDRLEEMAEKLYDSIFNKILPLGEGVILCPAHGAGSVCGGHISDRNLTTIGIEKNLNPELDFNNEKEFIKNTAEIMERPPYFSKMEKYNMKGPVSLSEITYPESLSVEKFKEELKKDDTVVLDTRMETNFASAHIPGSISIWREGLASFAGWFLPYDKNILIVNKGDSIKKETEILYRLGYDNIRGYLSGGVLNWHMAGNSSDSIATVTVDKLCYILDNTNKDISILDVRSKEEISNNGEIADSLNIHITQLPQHLNKIPEEKELFIFCGSGLRSMTAASLLKKKGFNNIKVVLGGLAGWSSTTCPVKYDK